MTSAVKMYRELDKSTKRDGSSKKEKPFLKMGEGEP